MKLLNFSIEFLSAVASTILTQGGITLNLTARYPFESKFKATPWAVAIEGHEVRIPTAEFSWENVREYVWEHQTELMKEGHNLGAWIDGGMVYLDCSIAVDRKSLAMEIAHEQNQLAIFNLVTFETITLEGDF